jgi:glycosyltransferase involved in cell wall biosynthesis
MIDVISESSDILKIGFIGRLTEDKGFSIFCDIAGKRKKDPSIEFYAAGRFNNDEIKLKELAENSGVTLLGFIPVNAFLEKVDIVVLPVKWREPFGRVVAECAMAGKVVITNFVGGITEISQQIENIYQLEDIDDLILSRKKGLLFDRGSNPFENKTISLRYLQYYQ